MNSLSVILIGLLGALFALTLKQYKPEIAIIISIVTVAIIILRCIPFYETVISEIKTIFNRTYIHTDYIIILLKVVGICYLTQFVSDICKDCGQTSIANNVELFGKISICISAIPLYKKLIELAEEIIGKAR